MIHVVLYEGMSRLFGYVSANPKLMTEEDVSRYRSAYCGLCRCLGHRHGQLTRLSLTYDMTFLALFLGAMYEPEETHESFWCVMHPKGQHDSLTTRYTEYAADMNVLLAYLNCLDNWKDDRSIVALGESLIFRKGYQEAVQRYPRQAEVIKREMEALEILEKEQCANPDLPANCFGRLLGELFVPHENDYFADELRSFGFYLGKFVYLYDACMDYETDCKRGSYNPLVLSRGNALSEAETRDLLSLYLSECVRIFDRLPIVQDSVIIKNILFSGVWQEFRKKYGKGGSGSTES